MLGAKPAVFISHSEQFRDQAAVPLRDYAESLGMKPILVSELPLPEMASSEPDAKVDYYLDKADMFVALVTPDERIESGVVHTRHNITDELSRARSRRHLAACIQVFKEPQVELHSNINPTYEKLDLEDVPAIFPIFRRQAIKWGLIQSGGLPPTSQSTTGPIGPSGDPDQAKSPPQHHPASDQAAVALDEVRGEYLGERDSASAASVARAHLATSAMLASLRSSELYGVHELNGLFRERASVQLTRAEKRHIARTVVARLDNGNAPGWYWLKTYGASDFHSLVIDMAENDPSDNLRVRALKLLATSRRSLPASAVKKLVQRGLEQDNWQNRSAALELLDAHGSLRIAQSLEDAVRNSAGGASTLLSIRARETPVAAFRALLVNPDLHTDQIEIGLLSNASKLPATVLRAALATEDRTVQLLALRALTKTSRLRKADIEPLLESDSPSALVKESVRVAIRRGWRLDWETVEKATEESMFDFGKSAALRVKYLKRRPIKQLREELSWIGGDGPNRYTAIGEMDFEAEADQIREDLRNDFERLRVAYRRHVEEVIRNATMGRIAKLALKQRPAKAVVEAVVDKEVDEFFDGHEGLEEFVIRQFRVAGLRILAHYGEAQDAKIARECLGVRDEVNHECIRVLERCGSAEDVDRLLELSENMRGDSAVYAAKVAMTLADDKSVVATKLIDAENYLLVLVGIEGFDASPSSEVARHLFPLLGHKREEVRQAATETLAQHIADNRYGDFIDFYISERDYYYYNVVVLLDRLMYAPNWLLRATKDTSG